MENYQKREAKDYKSPHKEIYKTLNTKEIKKEKLHNWNPPCSCGITLEDITE